MTSTARRVMTSYYYTATTTWVDFREAPWTGSAYDYYDSSSSDTYSTHPSATVAFDLKEVLHSPREAVIKIKNRAIKPFSDDATEAGAQGPWTDKVSQFAKVRVKDGQTGQIYFYGIIYDVQNNEDDIGGVLTLKCYDMLKELQDKTTIAAPSYYVSSIHDNLGTSFDRTSSTYEKGKSSGYGTPATHLKLALNNGSSDTTVNIDDPTGFGVGQVIQITNASDETEQMTITAIGHTSFLNKFLGTELTVTRATASFSAGYVADDPATRYSFTADTEVQVINNPSSRGGLIKSIINTNSLHLEVPSSGDSSDNRFQDSVVRVNGENTSAEFMLDDETGKPVLTEIQRLAMDEPHNSTLTDERTFGYDYYVSPNFTDATSTSENPQGYFNYFKRGTFPTTDPKYGTSGSTTTPSNGTFQQGLNIYYPSPSTTDAGSFTEKGNFIPMTAYDFSRAQSEIYTGARVTFDEAIGYKNTGPVVETKSTDFVYVEANTITNTGNKPFAFIWNEKVVTINPGGYCLIDGTEVDANGFRVTNPTNSSGTVVHESAEFLNVQLVQLSAACNNSQTTLTVDSDVRQSGLYVGQNIRVEDEVMEITGLPNATTINVNRNLNGVSGTDLEHEDNDWVEAWHVAKIQYVAKKAALSSGTYQNISSSGVLLSHIDKKLLEGHTTTYANQYWTVGGSSKTWIGDVSRTTMTLSYTPQNSYSFQRFGSFNFMNQVFTPSQIREKVFAALQRTHLETLRGQIHTYRPPRYHFTDQVTVTSTTGDGQTLVLQTAIGGSTNPKLAGIKIGTTVNQLNASGHLTGVYGYVNAIS